MGINLGDLVKGEEFELESLQGKIVGIDSFNVLYQFLSSIIGYDGSPLRDSSGRITSHLSGLLYRTTNLIEAGIKPAFIFDGKAHKLKQKTQQERRLIREEAEEKMLQAKKEGKMDEAKKYAQRAVRLTSEMIDESKKLVELMGLPVVQAPSEGEAQLAKMCSEGKIYATLSQDYDALLFGSPILLKNVTISGKRKLPGRDVYYEIKPTMIKLENVMKELQIDRKKLIWLGILLGTDFSEKFPNIGPKKAIKLVHGNNSFEDIIKETKFEPEFDYKEIEEIFMNPMYTEDYNLEFKEPDENGIMQFLCKERAFSEERVKKVIEKISEKAKERGKQASISSWFGKG
ncbi:MAG: flap endonuclease-1 [archaeon]